MMETTAARHLSGAHPSRTGGDDVTYVRLAFRGELGAHDPARPLDYDIVR
jgi:hypothetical protein